MDDDDRGGSDIERRRKVERREGRDVEERRFRRGSEGMIASELNQHDIQFLCIGMSQFSPSRRPSAMIFKCPCASVHSL